MNHFFKIVFYCFLFCNTVTAQKHDTLQTVTVTTVSNVAPSNTATPSQTIVTNNAAQYNSLSVADAVKFFTGVIVKDYGGIGGLKTIAVRSLGANHTGILYDGVPITNAQGGQIDVGKFSLDNIEQITLDNAAPQALLNTASAYAYAAVLSLKTSNNILPKNEKLATKLSLQQGSFGHISPSLTIKKAITPKLQMALQTQWQQANGAYKFKSYDNSGATEKRINSDVENVKIEYDAALVLNDTNAIKLKAFYYRSDRGLPGAVIFFNNTSNQRLKDDNFFVQTSWKKAIQKSWYVLLQSKYAADKNYYVDNNYFNAARKLVNDFRLKEWFASAVLQYKWNEKWMAAIANDVYYTTLQRKDTFAINFATPKRTTYLNNIALQYKYNKWLVNGNVLFTSIHDNVAAAKAGNNVQKLTPAIAVRYQPFASPVLKMRAFYKQIFRVPTFNDLYYTNIGNTNLLPEKAQQYNVGITFEKNNTKFLNHIDVTIDGYYNKVTNKIVAAPRQNLFQWSIQNIGIVDIKGVDVAAHLQKNIGNKWQVNSQVAYTFQQVLDVTNPASVLYKTMIPYTPKHSVSLHTTIQYQQWALSYNMLFSSYRYRNGDQTIENLLQGYQTNDAAISYTYLHKKSTTIKCIAEINNIFNIHYEIVKFYPMPLNNYRLTLIISTKK
ncbi:TonB-dependent receptor [Ferruginibacter yonginensis]|uniref:TonB-dependent receptor n=1 Tax=Ferruginibacter yonginensis TaxID=1310416 RepID=A0ABV8QMI6_9BACT